MGFSDSVASVIGNYATFSGRARRSEYWWWWLAVVGVIVAFGIVGSIFDSGLLGAIVNLGSLLFLLVVLIPSIAVAVRRLHDSGRSAWWLLVSFIPLVGGLIFLVLMVLPGTDGSNDYGAQPN